MTPEARLAAGQTVSLQDQCSTWMTPTVGDAKRGHHDPTLEQRGAGAAMLPQQASNWRTPSVMMTGERTSPETFEKRRSSLKAKHGKRTGNGAGVDLAMAAKTWPTPMARDWQGSLRDVPAGTGRPLDEVASVWSMALPPVSPDPPTPHGSASSTDGRNSPPPSARRRLNPFFVEALMRWPAGLSGFARAETAWTRWWALMPSCVSALLSTSGAGAAADRQGSLF